MEKSEEKALNVKIKEFGRYTGNAGKEFMLSFHCFKGISPGCLEGYEIWYGGDPHSGGEITYNNKTYKEC